MRFPSDGGRQLDSVVLVWVLALFVLVSPLRELWAGVHSPWFMPYVLWAGIIALIFWLTRRRGHHDL